ncbi:PLP-dependent aminotransferase family protein [Salinisphaera sp. RV14]|uniref:aminotransferase-like domain-containing protein n=1 Tax=Salinisphaera sp. RV14 TaxID=3454140 RepID=UPI003F872777
MQTRLYKKLADTVAMQIENGAYKPGDRLPSLRAFCEQHQVSMSSGVRTYRELEQRGLVKALDRSGYYVNQTGSPAAAPIAGRSGAGPVSVHSSAGHLRLFEMANQTGIIDLATAKPAADLTLARELEKSSKRVWREKRLTSVEPIFPPGSEELRRLIAQRMCLDGCRVAPEEVVITSGSQSAMFLALDMLTQPGDVVAVESPTDYGVLELIEQLGLRALPIPTDPGYGISMNAIELACQQWDVRAFVVIPNYNNPMGFCMFDQCKQQIVQAAKRYEIPVIENDAFGCFRDQNRRPLAIKAWDDDGFIYHCGSLMQAFGSSFGLGWLVLPKQRSAEVRRRQYSQNLCVDTHGQLISVDVLSRVALDRFYNNISVEYDRRTSLLARSIHDHFPRGTRISRPCGGYLLWVELPIQTDTADLLDDALSVGISFAPGKLFSTNDQFKCCMRFSSASISVSSKLVAVRRFAELVQQRCHSNY